LPQLKETAMYKQILVPVDGSDTARLGLQEAIKLAKTLGAKLRLLHVVDEAAMIQYAETPLYTVEMARKLEQQGRRLLEAAQAEVHKQGLEADTVLEKKLGIVSEAIVDHAKAWPAHVIVLGTHGRRGIGRLMMGSDAESVVRTSPVPVLLINAHATQQPRKSGVRRVRASYSNKTAH
jgi:nucleotide-binding universal stress UspA family protein